VSIISRIASCIPLASLYDVLLDILFPVLEIFLGEVLALHTHVDIQFDRLLDCVIFLET
jgi:hypothetical protein